MEENTSSRNGDQIDSPISWYQTTVSTWHALPGLWRVQLGYEMVENEEGQKKTMSAHFQIG